MLPWRMIILGIIISLMMGCKNSKSGGGGSSSVVSGSYTGKATIANTTGGAISVQVPNGPTVTLEIPEHALAQPADIALSVNPKNDSGMLAISIQPQPDLLESATLSVAYPSNSDNTERYMFWKGDANRLIPLKQSIIDGVAKSTLYHLGDFEYTLPDLNTMITNAYGLMNDTPSASWQTAYSAFDALVWFSSYFNLKGNAAESTVCMKATTDFCKQSADAFIASSKTDNSVKDTVYTNGLKKFRRLMVFVDNPGLITKTFDDLITAADNQQ